MFEQLLEISLPECDRMFFAGSEGGVPGIDDGDYKQNELYIHRYGITFPEVGDGPSQSQIYAAWVSGASANPVFTDSGNTCSS